MKRYRLRRGYEPPTTAALLALEADARLEEEDTMASLTPVKHLLLVVHGIGQKLEAAVSAPQCCCTAASLHLRVLL